MSRKADAGENPIQSKKEDAKSIEELRQEYRRLIKQFEARNENSAYDAVIEDLLNKLDELGKADKPATKKDSGKK